jgi:hypothetical protein
MKKSLIIIIVLYITTSLKSQTNNYFKNKNREYHYWAIYIDKNGDTITKESLIIKPLGHRWIAQPGLQMAIQYLYFTDTTGYRTFIDPIYLFHKEDVKYYKKKHRVRINLDETTGGFVNDTIFYMHPPRTNQYKMLFYAQHPRISLNKLTDSITTYMTSLTIYGMGIFKQKNEITCIHEISFNSLQIKAWRLFVTSKGEIKKHYEEEKIYNSTLDAIFTKEYGFVKLHYEFENGIKIQFDLKKVVEI